MATAAPIRKQLRRILLFFFIYSAQVFEVNLIPIS